MEIQVFDPGQNWSVVERRLPHWSQAGTVCFITIRMWDSIPREVLQRLLRERADWLKRHGISSSELAWRSKVDQLPKSVRHEFRRFIWERWENHLDECHGSCVLRKPQLAEIVASCLQHFQGELYQMTDFVVMPNHFHLIAAFADESGMLRQCESWKHFTANKLNRILGRDGRFWQQDGFDHLIRSADQFEYFRRYIADNPRVARLVPGEYLHRSWELT
jgi:type I restriction enzyme R subunit